MYLFSFIYEYDNLRVEENIDIVNNNNNSILDDLAYIIEYIIIKIL